MNHSAELVHCTFDATPICSSITGRTILVNFDESKFAILPGFSTERLAAASRDWATNCARLSARHLEHTRYGVSSSLLNLAHLCFSATDIDTFAHAIEGLIGLYARKSLRGTPKRISELLTILWQWELVAFPAGMVWRENMISTPALAEPDELFFGPFALPLSRLPYVKGASRSLRMLLTICGCAKAFADIDHAVLFGLRPFAPQPIKGFGAALCESLLVLQIQECSGDDTKLARLPKTYQGVFRVSSNEDTQEAIPTTSTELVHITFEVTPMRSELTGRIILPNYNESKFAILPDFSPERLALARSDWQEHRDDLGHRYLSSDLSQKISLCFSAGGIQAFAEAVELLIAHLTSNKNQRRQYHMGNADKEQNYHMRAIRIVEALTIMWRQGLIAFPAGEIWTGYLVKTKFSASLAKRFFGQLAEAIELIENNTRWGAQQRIGRMFFCACGGIVEIGDIDLRILSGFQPSSPRKLNLPHVFCDQLRLVQLETYSTNEAVLKLIPQSYRSAFAVPDELSRSSLDFLWARTAGPRVEAWRSSLAAYIAEMKNRITIRDELHSYNRLLDYVISAPSLPDNPLDYCARAYTPTLSFHNYLVNVKRNSANVVATTTRKASHFFSWVLKSAALDEDLQLLYRNPLGPSELVPFPSSPGQTYRAAIPTRFMRLMKEILEEDDFAWPKTIQNDYIESIDPDTGQIERIWSPVRAFFFLLRLQLPLREIQVRLLDSGEGDELVYRREQGGWVPNSRHLAPGSRAKRKPLGFIRQIWDGQSGKRYNGLYVTTNKTRDHSTLFTNNGYEIPWENADVIDLHCTLRDWQEKYNPCHMPLSRADLSDTSLLSSPDMVNRLDKFHFLFRDAANKSAPLEPLSKSRIRRFWYELVAELERRLEKEGITNDDGTKITLVTSWQDGRATGLIFDQHSLRVTGLTALAGAGVPIHVLREFVAGHATILMTLYYLKPRAGEITRVLEEALVRIQEGEPQDWAAYLRDQPLELIREITAYNSEEGLCAAKQAQSALWALTDYGICPNAGTKCNVGGPLVEGSGKNRVRTPVPGGSYNCALCRFFVTGPPFLGGLIAKFNETGGKMQEKSERFRQQQAVRRQILAEKQEAEEAGKVFENNRKLARAEEEIAKTDSELDVLWQTWNAQLHLVRRVETLMAQRRTNTRDDCGEQKNILVLNGQMEDFRVGFEPETATSFDLWDRICESSEFYPGIDAQIPAMRRGRLLDTMLAREGQPAVFAALSGEALVQVGNAFTRFMRTRFGDELTNALMYGRETLDKLGMGEEVMRELRHAIGIPVRIETQHGGTLALPSVTD